jgi:hypothetical protein
MKPEKPVSSSEEGIAKWTKFLAAQVPGIRPEAYPIVYRHRNCTHTRRFRDPDCLCPKYVYVKGERGRHPLYCTTWKLANDRVDDYCDARDVKQQDHLQLLKRLREQYGFVPMKIGDGFQAIIDSEKVARNADDQDPSIKPLRAMKRQFEEFLAIYNAKHKTSIETFDQITHELLERHWRPAWKVKAFNSQDQFLERLKMVMHEAQRLRWMPDERKQGKHGCECLVCKMADVQGAADVEPRTPFNQRMAEHGNNPDWQFSIIVRSCLDCFPSTKNRPFQARRLATFLQVGYCTGARISDVTNMQRKAVNLDTGWWTFVPKKTRKTTKKPRTVNIKLPSWLCDLLRKLPPASNSHPDYYFRPYHCKASGTTAGWHADLRTLWPLVDASAELRPLCGEDGKPMTDAEGNVCMGIQAPKTNTLVSLGFHLLRHTFVNRCRLGLAGSQRMEWAAIGELIGDDPETVRKEYGEMTKDVEESIAASLGKILPQTSPEDPLVVPSGAFFVAPSVLH